MKKDWAQTASAFHRFLTWLDEGVDSHGEKYLEMRRRLVSYFGRKRCLSPDELADETLTRVARRLAEEGAIAEPPARYCYITAKYVFLESLRATEHRQVSFAGMTDSHDPASQLAAPGGPDAGAVAWEASLERLERCLEQLKPDDRALILEYYRGEQRIKIERRRKLAARLGMTANALSIRACRIRDKLEACVNAHRVRPDMFRTNLSHLK